MKPIVTTKGKSAQLRYELPHRVFDTKVYPVTAPNGSNIVLYGHETGIGVLWRGGRPLKAPVAPAPPPLKPAPKTNGTQSAIVIIDSDDDEPAPSASQKLPPAEFEDDEEELDPDTPYPSIVQHLRLPLNTSVLHIAVPPVPSPQLHQTDTVPPIFSNKIVFVIACSDFSVRMVTLPLSPPPRAAEPFSGAKTQFGEEILKIPTHVGHQTIPTGVTVTWTSQGEPSHTQPSDDEMDVDGDIEGVAAAGRRSPRKKQTRARSATRSDGFDLLVASHSTELGGLVKIWRFALSETSIKAANPISPYQALTLRHPAVTVAFNTAVYPKRRHSRLLITDSSGAARVYDLFAARKRRTGAASDSGAFVALFRTAFEETKSHAHSPPVLAVRKGIIGAAWAGNGHHVIALLADGEWGVWDVDRTGPNPPTNPSLFSMKGYVGLSDEKGGAAPSSPKARSNRTLLAPMTPNTRKRKEESLFHGNSSGGTVPTRGGISVATLPTSAGNESEDSVVIWYGAEVHRISDFARFWIRSSGGSSLSGSGLLQIQELSLLGESIMSIDQFHTTVQDTQSAIPRDIIVATEHRLNIVSRSIQPSATDDSSASNERADAEEIRRSDQARLNRGELDLGGMERLLEDMEASQSGSRSLSLGNPRRVLFASSGA